MRLLRWASPPPRTWRRVGDTVGERWLRQRVRIALPLALSCVWLAQPTSRSLWVGAAIAILGLLVRGAAASHLAKNAALTVSGPYAFSRHPLYLGSAVVGVGLLLAAHSGTAALLGLAYFALFYPAAVRREERKLRARHGALFERYAARVPLFWPRLRAAGSIRFAWSWSLYWRNGEYRAALGLLLALALLWLKMHQRT